MKNEIRCENPVLTGTTVSLKYSNTTVEKLYVDVTNLFKTMTKAERARILLPGENQDIRVDVNEMLSNGSEWLATPNSNFGGRRPADLIDTPEESLLRETLRSAIYSGMA